MMYLGRRLSKKIKKITDNFPVTVLTGARQVGKSTLLQKEFPEYVYLSLDDFSLQEKVMRDPASPLSAGAEKSGSLNPQRSFFWIRP